MSRGKKYRELLALVDRDRRYPLEDGLELVVQTKRAKFDETVDMAVRLGVDVKQTDQQVRGAVALPHGLGKSAVVVVFAQGEKAREAHEAQADFVGGQDLVDKISGGWLEFDKVVAAPDMMVLVSKVGKILGPRGLMPNPKTQTVTFEIARAVKECKAGRVEFRTDKAGIIHAPLGKVSFGAGRLKDNLVALLETLVRLKPAASKGIYIRTLTVSATMGPGIKIDPVIFAL